MLLRASHHFTGMANDFVQRQHFAAACFSIMQSLINRQHQSFMSMSLCAIAHQSNWCQAPSGGLLDGNTQAEGGHSHAGAQGAAACAASTAATSE